MANRNQPPAIQRAHSSNQVGYGHVGTATYDEKEHRWTFLRDIQPVVNPLQNRFDHNSSVFRQVKDSSAVIVTAKDIGENQTPTERARPNAFLKALPDIAFSEYHQRPATYLEYQHKDEKVVTGSLLAFGNCLILGINDVQSGFQTAPIAAFADLAVSDEVHLLRPNTETVEVDAESSETVEVATLPRIHTTIWRSANGPVRQLCFSAEISSQKDTWLAVRQTGATSIFQPLLRHTKTADAKLDFNLLVQIPISRTGGLQHSDVNFHPQDPRRLALVDEGGHWSIWNIKGTRSRTAQVHYQVELLVYGSFVSVPESLQQFDGWHKLIWLSSNEDDFDRLLIANRQTVRLLDVRGNVCSEYKVQIGSKPEGWVLDMSPAYSLDEFFILTATRIFCMHSRSDDADLAATVVDKDISVIASVRHFRIPSGTALRLYLLKYSNGTWLFLTSTGDSTITTYSCQQTRVRGQMQHQLSDPVSLTIRSSSHMIAIHAVASKSSNQKSTKSTKPEKAKEKILNLFKIFSHSDTGAIFETLFHVDLPEEISIRLVDLIPVPRERLLRHKSTFRVKDNSLEDSLDSFVVSNDEDVSNSVLNQINALASKGAKVAKGFKIAMNASDAKGSTDTEVSTDTEILLSARYNKKLKSERDLSRAWDAIMGASLNARVEQEPNFEAILKTVETELSNRKVAQTLLGHVAALPATIHTSDIEHDSQWLQAWLQQLGNSQRQPDQRYTSVLTGSHDSLLSLYDELVERSGPLPASFSDRARVQRERLLRQMALEEFLSTIVIRPSLPDRPEEEVQESDPTSLPSAMEQLAMNSQPDSPSSQTFEPSQTAAQLEYPSQSLLSKHTNFKQSAALGPATSTSLTKLLDYLRESSDVNPAEFDYEKVRLGLEQAGYETPLWEMDPKARRRAEKEARARRKKLDKQAQLRKAVSEQSNTLPSIVSSQLPTVRSSQLPLRAVQSSQGGPAAGGSSQPSMGSVPGISMTQPERGTFGGRDVKKGKGKGKAVRQKGF